MPIPNAWEDYEIALVIDSFLANKDNDNYDNTVSELFEALNDIARFMGRKHPEPFRNRLVIRMFISRLLYLSSRGGKGSYGATVQMRRLYKKCLADDEEYRQALAEGKELLGKARHAFEPSKAEAQEENELSVRCEESDDSALPIGLQGMLDTELPANVGNVESGQTEHDSDLPTNPSVIGVTPEAYAEWLSNEISDPVFLKQTVEAAKVADAYARKVGQTTACLFGVEDEKQAKMALLTINLNRQFSWDNPKPARVIRATGESYYIPFVHSVMVEMEEQRQRTAREEAEQQAATIAEEERQRAIREEEAGKAAAKAEEERQRAIREEEERKAAAKAKEEQLKAIQEEETRKATARVEEERQRAIQEEEERKAAARAEEERQKAIEKEEAHKAAAMVEAWHIGSNGTTQTAQEDEVTASIIEHGEEKGIASRVGELRRVDHDHFSLWLDQQNIGENTRARILYVIDAADAFARQNHMPKARLYGITDAWQGSYALNMMVAKRAFAKASPDAARQLNQYGRAYYLPYVEEVFPAEPDRQTDDGKEKTHDEVLQQESASDNAMVTTMQAESDVLESRQGEKQQDNRPNGDDFAVEEILKVLFANSNGNDTSKNDAEKQDVPSTDENDLNRETDECRVDFDDIGDLSYTKPVCLTYNGATYTIGSWRELYCKAVTLVCEANDGKLIQRYLDKDLPGCRYVLFAGQKGKRRMLSARRITPGVYIESHGSATSLMKRLGDVLRFFNVSDGRPSVTYMVTDPEMRRLKAEAESAGLRKSAVISRKIENTETLDTVSIVAKETVALEQAPVEKDDSSGDIVDTIGMCSNKAQKRELEAALELSEATAAESESTEPDKMDGEEEQSDIPLLTYAHYLDFSDIGDLSGTKPICLEYRGRRMAIDKWDEMYAEAIKLLFDNHDQQLARMFVNKSIPGSIFTVFTGEYGKRYLKNPRKIANNLYVDCAESATGLMARLKAMLTFYAEEKNSLKVAYLRADLDAVIPAQSTGDALLDEISAARLTYRDNRDKGGCLWVFGGMEITEDIRRIESSRNVCFRYKWDGPSNSPQPAWWTKDATASPTDAVSGHDSAKPGVPDKAETVNSAIDTVSIEKVGLVATTVETPVKSERDLAAQEYQIDFDNIKDLSGTRPVSFEYDGIRTEIGDWNELYYQAILALFRAHKERLPVFSVNQRVMNKGYVLFANDMGKRYLQNIQPLSKHLFVNCEGEPTILMSHLADALALYCETPNAMHITYLHITSEKVQEEAQESQNTTADQNVVISQTKAESSSVAPLEFDALFKDGDLQRLRDSLIESGIQTVEELGKTNLWVFMNRRGLYDIRTRQRIASRIADALEQANRNASHIQPADNVSRRCRLVMGGQFFPGETPSEALLEFLKYLAKTYPLGLRTAIGLYHPTLRELVLYKEKPQNNHSLNLFYPIAYIRSDLTSEQAHQYAEWLANRCSIRRRIGFEWLSAAEPTQPDNPDEAELKEPSEAVESATIPAEQSKGDSGKQPDEPSPDTVAPVAQAEERPLIDDLGPNDFDLDDLDADDIGIDDFDFDDDIDDSGTRPEQGSNVVVEQVRVPEKTLVQPTQYGERDEYGFVPGTIIETQSQERDWLAERVEKELDHDELNPIGYDTLKVRLGATMASTKAAVNRSKHIVDLQGRLYHDEAFVDFDEAAEQMKDILERLMRQGNGYVSANQLVEYVKAEMQMFLNDNDISQAGDIFDLARHWFEKVGYGGRRYVFKGYTHISLPGETVESLMDLAKRFAREHAPSFTYEDLEAFVRSKGFSTGNMRAQLQMYTKPIFLAYAWGEFMLSELMGIDDAWLASIRQALDRLFADAGEYVVIRDITDGWLNLLPVLPDDKPWTRVLLQNVIYYYSEQLNARTISSTESRVLGSVDVMLVRRDSWIKTFGDAVAVFLHDEESDESEYEAETLRRMLVNRGMLDKNEMINRMPKMLPNDGRFAWSSDKSRVKVRLD